MEASWPGVGLEITRAEAPSFQGFQESEDPSPLPYIQPSLTLPCFLFTPLSLEVVKIWPPRLTLL